MRFFPVRSCSRTLDNDGTMVRGNGNITALKISLVTTMLPIYDPSARINATLKAQSDKTAAIEAANKAEQEQSAEIARKEAERYKAEQAKYLPTGRK